MGFTKGSVSYTPYRVIRKNTIDSASILNVPRNPDRKAYVRPASTLPADARKKRTEKRNAAQAARRKNRKLNRG